MLLAHFTPSEIPGSLFLIAAGVCLGAMIVKGRFSWLPALLLGLALFSFLDVIAAGWASWLQTSIDVVWLAAALAVSWVLLRDRPRTRSAG